MDTWGKGNAGFSLLEVLVVITIVAVLMAILAVATASARRRAREVQCISQLSQIGKAITRYRQDNGGGDPPEAKTVAELGLPSPSRFPTNLYPYLKDKRVLICPDDPYIGTPGYERDIYLYSYQFLFLHEEKDHLRYPAFSKWVERYGTSVPIVLDVDHGKFKKDGGPNAKASVLVLRLDGTVERKIIPRDPNSYWSIDWSR